MSRDVMTLNGHEIHLKNVNKVLFPQSGITKKEVISYYSDISPTALPYYLNRPLTMERCPDGIGKQNFIQKNIPAYFPEWMDRWELPKIEGKISHILVNKAATLVYLANQACIAFHLGLSEVNKINYPRYLILDLDPSHEDIFLLKTVAKRIGILIKELDLVSYIQTTGSRGFHIYISLDQNMAFEEVHNFAKTFATYLSETHLQEITVEQSKEKRGKRVYLDYTRNAYGLHAIAPYSLRAKENAPIATPLHWEELEDKNLHSQSYNIKNIFKRLNATPDPWKDMLKHPQSLELAQIKLAELLKKHSNSPL